MELGLAIVDYFLTVYFVRLIQVGLKVVGIEKI
jgi:hypothetical protein